MPWFVSFSYCFVFLRFTFPVGNRRPAETLFRLFIFYLSNICKKQHKLDLGRTGTVTVI